MHFCVLTARVYALFSCPRKIGLNWFIPALVNSSVGSSTGTHGDEGTNVCPSPALGLARKKSMNVLRIASVVRAGGIASSIRAPRASEGGRARSASEASRESPDRQEDLN